MKQIQVTNGQVAQACRSGLELLNTEGVMIPAKIAMSGDLMVLQQALMSLATGAVVLAKAEEEPESDATPPSGGAEASLQSIDGGKE